MAANLEYIYTLKDLYSKRLAAITKAQVVFTREHTKSMGKVNAALSKNTTLLEKNTTALRENAKTWGVARAETSKFTNTMYSSTNAYSTTRSAMSRVATQLDTMVAKQQRYTKALRETNRFSMARGATTGGIPGRPNRGVSGSRGGITSDKLGALTAGTGGGFFLRGAITTAADFYSQMNNIRAVIPNVDRELMKSKAIEWGNTTIFKPRAVAGAMAEAAQAGMTQNEILKSMPGNLALAAAGNMDLVEAMKLSTDVVVQFGKTIDNQFVADLLAKGSKSTSKVHELGAALGNFGTVAHGAGISAKETMAMIMGVGESGSTLRGEGGGTYLMNMVRAMQSIKNSPKRVMAMHSFLSKTGHRISDVLNVSTGQLTNAKLLMKLLANADKSSLVGLSTSFRIQGAKAINALAALDDVKLEKIWKTLENVNGSAKEMADIKMEGLPGALARLDSAWETSKIMMQDSYIPAMAATMEGLAGMLVSLQTNHKWVLQIFFGLVALTTVITGVGFALWAVSGALGAWGVALAFMWKWSGLSVIATKALAAAQWLLIAAMMASPLTWVVVGLTAWAAILGIAYYKTGSFTDALKILGGVVIKSALTPITLMMEAVRGLFYLLSKMPKGLGGDFFGKAFDNETKRIEALQMFLTGNKSHFAPGMIYDLLSKEGKDISSWMTPKTEGVSRQATRDRNENRNYVELGGGVISLQTGEGIQVEQAEGFGALGFNVEGY